MAVGRLDRREEMVRNFEKFQKGHFYIYTGDTVPKQKKVTIIKKKDKYIKLMEETPIYSNWIANIRT